MKKKINTYETLGRFLMNQTYNILLGTNDWKIEYPELKRRLQEQIDTNPQIDKKFAMHKYNHGTKESILNMAAHTWKKPSTEHLSTYRWENVLYYYINQHEKSAFMELVYYTDKIGTHDYVALRQDYLQTYWYSQFFRIQPDMNYMFDKARQLNKDAAEKLLNKSTNLSLSKTDRHIAEYQLIANEGILPIYEHSIYNRCK